VRCHFSKSMSPSFRCSFSGLPFHGSSVCLVLGQSVFWRGSSWGVSRGSSSWGSFFSVLMALQCKWLLIVPQDKKTKAVQPKGGEVPMRKMPVQGMLQRCRHRQVRMRRERQAHPVRLLLDQQALQPVGRVQPNQLDRPITEPGRASDPAAVSMV
jgi:hypothetical protein